MKIILNLFFLFWTPLLYCGVERFLDPVFVAPPKQTSHQIKSALYGANLSENLDLASNAKFSGAYTLTTEKVEMLLSNALKHRYQVNGQIVVTLTNSWDDLEANSEVFLKIKDCSPDDISSSCFVRFSLWQSGTKIGDFSSPLRISHLKEVYFSKSALPRGKVLNKNDFFSRNVDILKNHANSVPFSTDLSGYELQTNLNASSPVKWSFLSKATVIRKGQVVDVFASGNGIYVTMKGIALEDGLLDSSVRIKNISSDKEFQAKVLSENSVKVHL